MAGENPVCKRVSNWQAQISNDMQRRPNPFQNPQPVTIRWQGRAYSLAEAGALAAKEYQAGNLETVAEIYRLMLAKVPRAAELHNNLGAILQLRERYDEALACYDKAVTLKPDYANAFYNRGFVLRKLNRVEDALASYEKAIALNPNHTEAHNNRGALLQWLRRYNEARASYDKAIALNLNHVEAHNNRGTTLMSLGDVAGAEKMFQRAVELKPDFAEALFNLSSIRKHLAPDQMEINRLRELLGRANLSVDDREQLHFSLGKIFDDCGNYDEAFESYWQGNELRNARVKYDSNAVAKGTDEIIQVFTPEFLATPPDFAGVSRAPILIVGMPRSGTTLLAQILSSHPAVAAAGELSFVSDFLSQLPGRLGDGKAYPQAVQNLTPVVAAQFTDGYERRLRRDLGQQMPHVIDKNPLNFQHLGFIARLFPNVRIFHCTRHPLDTCLSIYFQRFPLALDFAFDLRHIGHFYQQYARLMAHWQKIPAIPMFEVRYEDLIRNTETTARQALEFLGLPWDERCLSPHKNPGSVETASHWQVRQPIYQHALNRWQHYEKHLGPLKEILAAAG
jgi:tetratricopeptide (TPR) repeat protein